MVTLRNQKGFTLIELIMVLVILGILASIAIPRYTTLQKDAEYAAVQGMVAALNAAAALRFAENQIAAANGRTTTLLTTAALLGALLDPAFSTTNYPKWSINGTGGFDYAGASKTWTGAFTAETGTVRALVALPTY